MKKFLFSMLILVPFLSSCDALSELTKIPLPFEQSITIPAIPVIGSTSIETPDIETGIDSVLNEAGISTDLIEGITLSKMEFALSSSSDDLSFLKDVDIYISTSGKDDVKIATATNVGDVSTLKFTALNVDIKDFIMGDKFKLKVNIKTDEPLLAQKEVDIKMEFILDLKVMGL